MDNRPFVGCNDMGSVCERAPNMVDRWLPVFDVEKSSLEEHIGLSRIQPIAITVALFSVNFSERTRTCRVQKFGNRKADRVYAPADSPGRNTRNAPFNAVALTQFAVCFLQEFNQRTINVAESDKAETIELHECESISRAGAAFGGIWPLRLSVPTSERRIRVESFSSDLSLVIFL